MPSLFGLQSLSSAAVLVAIVVTAALIVLVADWRLALFALALQYLLLGIFLATLVPAPIAMIRLIAGGLAVAILFLSMQTRAGQDRLLFPRHPVAEPETVSSPARQVFVIGFPFRLMAVAFVVVTMVGLVSSNTFLGLPARVFFASVWLIACGLLTATLSREALRLGLGILVFTGGFGVLEIALEGSLLLYGLLNISDLLIAVVIAHLATVPGDTAEHLRRGDVP